MKRKSTYSKKELLRASSGISVGGVTGKLPEPPMLMIDEITHISQEGGDYNKGEIIAEFKINPKLWFFFLAIIKAKDMPKLIEHLKAYK